MPQQTYRREEENESARMELLKLQHIKIDWNKNKSINEEQRNI